MLLNKFSLKKIAARSTKYRKKIEYGCIKIKEVSIKKPNIATADSVKYLEIHFVQKLT